MSARYGSWQWFTVAELPVTLRFVSGCDDSRAESPLARFLVEMSTL
jgi:hypothetical protein